MWKTKTSMERIAVQMESRIPIEMPGDATRPAPLTDSEEVLQPYFGVDNTGYLKYLEELLVYYSTDASKREYKILILGGSVAGMFGYLGADPLVRSLRQDARFRERGIKLISQGRGGFKQPQQVTALVYLLSLGCKFDAIINIDGFNEVALGMNNASSDANPAYPSLTHWGSIASPRRQEERVKLILDELRARRVRAREIVDFTVKNNFYYSAILGNLAFTRVKRLHLENALATDAYLKSISSGVRDAAVLGPAFDKDPKKVAEQSVAVWSSSSNMIRAICENNGILYLHFLQPTLHDKGSKTLSEEEIRAGAAPPAYVDGVSLGYPLLREAGVDLAAKGEAFFDMSRLFKKESETIYVDNCHFGTKGNALLAEAVAAAIIKKLPK